jgi:ABC-type Na+ efflux pump permease subunit
VDSGPAGLALVTGGIVAAVFAFGTLVFTVIGITVAPQVVMFVGLTHATMGLDRVRSGGADDPDAPHRPGRSRFRTWTRLMLVGFFMGGLLLAVAVAAAIDR